MLLFIPHAWHANALSDAVSPLVAGELQESMAFLSHTPKALPLLLVRPCQLLPRPLPLAPPETLHATAL